MPIHIVRADYALPEHAQAILSLLDHYASGVAGGGKPLRAEARAGLIPAMAMRPYLFSVLVFDDELAVGLLNAIEGFSTFAAQPLINIHDVIVLESHRRCGIGALLFAEAGAIAHERGACKLTLEVLEGNKSARALYEKLGFEPYQLDPAMGSAHFLSKPLSRCQS